MKVSRSERAGAEISNEGCKKFVVLVSCGTDR